MGSPSDNVAKLQAGYRQWHESKGGSVKAWLDLMVDDVKCYSLAGGAPGAEFTAAITSKKDFERYFKGLLEDWEMIHYKTDEFIAEGDRVAMRGSTAWRNRRPDTLFHAPDHPHGKDTRGAWPETPQRRRRRRNGAARWPSWRIGCGHRCSR